MPHNDETSKNYRYRLLPVITKGEETPQYSDAGRRNIWVNVYKIGDSEIECRKGLFKPVLGVRARDYKQNRFSASNFGEFIASKVLEKIEVPRCDVILAEKTIALKYSKSKRDVKVPGCITFLNLTKGDSLLHANIILEWYRNTHNDACMEIIRSKKRTNTIDEKDNNNIELVIPAFTTYAKEMFHATNGECEQVKQDIINMVTFDCKFANTDRNDENYALKFNPTEKKTNLYPLFDNEYILGLSEYKDKIISYTAPLLQEHIDKKMISRMGITCQPTNVGYQTMMAYLFTTYPKETQKAYNCVMKFTESDLVNLMNQCEGLSDIHKDYALKIFRSRNKGFQYVKKEYDHQHLEDYVK